jgi:hypothetical protein
MPPARLEIPEPNACHDAAERAGLKPHFWQRTKMCVNYIFDLAKHDKKLRLPFKLFAVPLPI